MNVEVTGAFGAVMQGFSVDVASLADEGWPDPARGDVTWRTLIGRGETPSSGLVAGLATFGPGGRLNAHRHAAPEFYFGLEGEGVVTVDGTPHRIAAGICVYLPPDAEHATVAGEAGLRMLYAFPVDRFEEVEYRFSVPLAAND